ncbi:hypothetical protein RFI_36248 [Reticulomyxa filosa]|uniref:Uncharacterized protein n=1 Tax=Reticulomyxa filosa TaxID=46433 RepID=X6LHU8_RETFI|nr:hypothetical protein RFI_36248 [Reticulomyxa filosa]|eukprot:ETO01194.1 hypothetical protein RFI_36248 [Reticulomyxa filosa]
MFCRSVRFGDIGGRFQRNISCHFYNIHYCLYLLLYLLGSLFFNNPNHTISSLLKTFTSTIFFFLLQQIKFCLTEDETNSTHNTPTLKKAVETAKFSLEKFAQFFFIYHNDMEALVSNVRTPSEELEDVFSLPETFFFLSENIQSFSQRHRTQHTHKAYDNIDSIIEDMNSLLSVSTNGMFASPLISLRCDSKAVARTLGQQFYRVGVLFLMYCMGNVHISDKFKVRPGNEFSCGVRNELAHSSNGDDSNREAKSNSNGKNGSTRKKACEKIQDNKLITFIEINGQHIYQHLQSKVLD